MKDTFQNSFVSIKALTGKDLAQRRFFPYFHICCRIVVRHLFNKQAHLLHLNAEELSLFPGTQCVDKRSVIQISLTNETYEAWWPLHNALYYVARSYQGFWMGRAAQECHLLSWYVSEGKEGQETDVIIYKCASQESSSEHTVSKRGTRCGSSPFRMKALLCINT